MWNFGPIAAADFRAPARKVTRVFLHCTDSDAPELVGTLLAAEVDRWHREGNHWSGVGYHFLVDKHGQAVTGRPLELVPAAQLGPDGLGNVATIAISTHGSKHWTAEGLEATRELCRAIDAAYAAMGTPVTFWGHTEIDPRPCPVYDWRRLLGLGLARRFGELELGDPALVAAAAMGGTWPRLELRDNAGALAPIGHRALSEGCHGDDVADLQRALLAAGFDPKGDDGWFGRNTYAAVVAWQRARGVTPANGIVRPGELAH